MYTHAHACNNMFIFMYTHLSPYADTHVYTPELPIGHCLIVENLTNDAWRNVDWLTQASVCLQEENMWSHQKRERNRVKSEDAKTKAISRSSASIKNQPREGKCIAVLSESRPWQPASMQWEVPLHAPQYLHFKRIMTTRYTYARR